MSEQNENKGNQLVIFGVILVIGAIISTWLFMGGVIKYQKLQNQTITVTGSASKEVKSDFAAMNIGFKAKASDLKTGYRIMNTNKEKIKDFLIKEGVQESEIDFSLITNYAVNKRIGNYMSNEIEFYNFDSHVRVSSKNIDLITSISKKIDTLINNDVEVGYSNVEYYVSDIDNIKIEMVGAATKNAKERAKAMVESTGDKIGSLNNARMGVFQIVPVNSTEVSDYGINDTTSINKKVVAVVNATFTVK